MVRRSRPDLVFGPSSRFVIRNDFILPKQRCGCNLFVLRKLAGNLLESGLVEAHAFDPYLAVGRYQENRGNVSESIGVRDRIPVAIENRREPHSKLLVEVLRVPYIVLRNAENRNVLSRKPIGDTLKEWKCELADRARNLKERENDGAASAQRREGVCDAVQCLERKIGSSRSTCDVHQNAPPGPRLTITADILYFSSFRKETALRRSTQMSEGPPCDKRMDPSGSLLRCARISLRVRLLRGGRRDLERVVLAAEINGRQRLAVCILAITVGRDGYFLFRNLRGKRGNGVMAFDELDLNIRSAAAPLNPIVARVQYSASNGHLFLQSKRSFILVASESAGGKEKRETQESNRDPRQFHKDSLDYGRANRGVICPHTHLDVVSAGVLREFAIMEETEFLM